nr:hypothetical protein [Acinetobacter sp. Marseille-Q1620]
MNKILQMAVLPLCSLFSFTAHAALTAEKLQNLIECKALHKDYVSFSDEYMQGLKDLGWKHVDAPEHPFIYLYKNEKPVTFFGLPTQEIALASSAITAVYRNVDVQKLSKQFDIPRHPDFESSPVFRGEKIVRTEPATAETFTYHDKLILSEMKGQNPIVLLGCSYEADENEVSQSFDPDEAE